MGNIGRYFDTGTLFVIFLTLVLFVAALYYTGFTHDVLLETGVFLVSVKLILMSYHNKLVSDALLLELGEIRSLIEELRNKSPAN